jgi:hypothetical protein
MTVNEFMSQIDMIGSVCQWSDAEKAMQAMSHLSKHAYAVLNQIPQGPWARTYSQVKVAFKTAFEPRSQVQANKAELDGLRRDPRRDTPHVFAGKVRRMIRKAFPDSSEREREERTREKFISAQTDDVKFSLATLISGEDEITLDRICAAVAHHEAIARQARLRKTGSGVAQATAGDRSSTNSSRDSDSDASYYGKGRRHKRSKRAHRDTAAVDILSQQMQTMAALQTQSAMGEAAGRVRNANPGWPITGSDKSLGSSVPLQEVLARVNMLDLAEVQVYHDPLLYSQGSAPVDPVEVLAYAAMGRTKTTPKCFVCDSPTHLWRACGLRDYVKDLVRQARTNPNIVLTPQATGTQQRKAANTSEVTYGEAVRRTGALTLAIRRLFNDPNAAEVTEDGEDPVVTVASALLGRPKPTWGRNRSPRCWVCEGDHLWRECDLREHILKKVEEAKKALDMGPSTSAGSATAQSGVKEIGYHPNVLGVTLGPM